MGKRSILLIHISILYTHAVESRGLLTFRPYLKLSKRSQGSLLVKI